jgi:RES domain-containing protein
MLCFRLTRHPDLSGEGGRLNAARWHSAGRPIVYTAESDALAILEVRVNLDLAFDLLPVQVLDAEPFAFDQRLWQAS